MQDSKECCLKSSFLNSEHEKADKEAYFSLNNSSQVFGRYHLLMISPAFLSMTKYQLLTNYSTTSIFCTCSFFFYLLFFPDLQYCSQCFCRKQDFRGASFCSPKVPLIDKRKFHRTKKNVKSRLLLTHVP